LLLGILLAGVAGFLLLITRRRQRRQHLPYAFFLSAAGLVILLFVPRY
jgi:hypothetical protein